MSAPGYTNLHGSAANGPSPSYTSMYQPAGCYGEPPLQQNYTHVPNCTSVSSKPPLTNSGHSTNYYQQNHVPPQYVAYSSPASAVPLSQPYPTVPSSTDPPSSAQYSQQPSYGTPGCYYGHQSFPAPPPAPPHLQQSSVVPAGSSGTAGYPVVSYPSAPGSSQYDKLASSQSSSSCGVLHTQMGAPLHQYSTPGGPTETSQAQSTAQQSFEPSQQASSHYNLYSGLKSDSGGADASPCSGHPSASVPPSPGCQHGSHLLYGYVANSEASCASAAISDPAGPSLSSSEDDEEEDEEAGGDTSSSSTGSASPVPISYDSLEGGNYPDAMLPSNEMQFHAQPYGCYGYPSMQPAYLQGPPSHREPSQSHNMYSPSSYQPYAQQPFPSLSQLSSALGGLSGIPELELESLRQVNLLQERNLLPHRPLGAPEPNLSPDLKKVNCSPETFRCTLSSIPQTQALLNKARLPLGLLLHPFRDLQMFAPDQTLLQQKFPL